jgi:hypothetical protein
MSSSDVPSFKDLTSWPYGVNENAIKGKYTELLGLAESGALKDDDLQKTDVAIRSQLSSRDEETYDRVCKDITIQTYMRDLQDPELKQSTMRTQWHTWRDRQPLCKCDSSSTGSLRDLIMGNPPTSRSCSGCVEKFLRAEGVLPIRWSRVNH